MVRDSYRTVYLLVLSHRDTIISPSWLAAVRPLPHNFSHEASCSTRVKPPLIGLVALATEVDLRWVVDVFLSSKWNQMLIATLSDLVDKPIQLRYRFYAPPQALRTRIQAGIRLTNGRFVHHHFQVADPTGIESITGGRGGGERKCDVFGFLLSQAY